MIVSSIEIHTSNRVREKSGVVGSKRASRVVNNFTSSNAIGGMSSDNDER